MKKKRVKYIFYSILVIMVSVTLHQFYSGHHDVSNELSRKYLFIFKDSTVNKIDKNIAGWSNDHDIINNFIYDETYLVKIWEFNDLKNYNIEDAFINKHSIINKSTFNLQETIYSSGPCPISIKYLYKIDGIILNLDENSKIIKEFHGTNYKGFYGLIDKMSICDKKGKPQVYFNFTKSQTATILLFYKSHNNFYLIMITSKKEFDEKIIKILNLN